MLRLTRSSDFFDKLLEQKAEKKCFFDRAFCESAKDDPFKDREIDNNIWKIKGNKLLKKIKLVEE